MKFNKTASNGPAFKKAEKALKDAGFKQFFIAATDGEEEREDIEPDIRMTYNLGLSMGLAVSSGLLVNTIKKEELPPEVELEVLQRVVEVILKGMGFNHAEVKTILDPGLKDMMN
jgi:predicted nucleotide-binding protein (sugar kinase/HSP70/actin superfamily)